MFIYLSKKVRPYVNVYSIFSWLYFMGVCFRWLGLTKME